MATKGAIRLKKQRDLTKSFTLLAAIIGSVMLLFEDAFWVAGLSLLVLSLSMRFVLTLTSGKTVVSSSAAKQIPTTDDANNISQILLSRPEALRLIPEAMARKYTAIPLEVTGNLLRVAMANPADILALEALASQSQMHIVPTKASGEVVQNAIDSTYQYYEEIKARVFEQPIEQDIVTDAPVARALELIINEAVKSRASEIHFQPQKDKLMVGYRINGSLHNMIYLPLMVATPLISRIKVLANMNIADHRPQKGQFVTRARDRDIVCKVATTSTKYGEKVVLLLSSETPLKVSGDIEKQITDLLSKADF